MNQNKFIPNSFQVPNAIIDEFLSSLSSTATKCYLFICRKTTGWNKVEDSISISQFQTYLNIKDDRTVTKALKELCNIGLIKAKKSRGKVTKYSLIQEPKNIKVPTKNAGIKDDIYLEKLPSNNVPTENEVGIKNVPTNSQPKVPTKNVGHNIPIQKEEEKEEEYIFKSIKKFIDKILSDEVAYEVFAIDFYDYVYPKNKKSLQQKIWYGNSIRDSILQRDKKTLKNIYSFVEFQDIQKFCNSRKY